MKFFKYVFVSALFLATINSCQKESKNLWNVEIKNPSQSVELIDISKEFYGNVVPLEDFKQKYPWFQGTVPDEDYALRRADAEEIKIYQEAISKIDQVKLQKELTDLVSHIQYYFSDFRTPKFFLYSSALQGIMDPIFYEPKENLVFVDITAFMGDNNPNYEGLEVYFQSSMNPQNIVPKISETIAKNFVVPNSGNQKFLDEMIYHGKILTLQDAFLPEFPEYLKMNYTQKQYEWSAENEVNIWNFFVENNLLFSDDLQLNERFIKPGPFSKFYTEIDNESSPRVGIYIGGEICKKFFKENPDVKLASFIQMDAQKIFTDSQYKPKN